MVSRFPPSCQFSIPDLITISALWVLPFFLGKILGGNCRDFLGFRAIPFDLGGLMVGTFCLKVFFAVDCCHLDRFCVIWGLFNCFRSVQNGEMWYFP